MTRRFLASMPRRGLAGAALATMTLLAGCAPIVVGGMVVGGAMVATDRRTSGSQVDDEMIELKAGSRMDEAFPDGRANISTTSYNRMVLLTGEVAKDADKTTAGQVVARVENVVSVVNELSVGPASSFNETSKDVLITTQVKASLVDAKDLLAHSIKVVTHRRVVYLMGRVTEREATRAAEVARGVSGVAKVVRVFEIVTEAELASSQQKAPPAKAASSP
jgi:osmotically-inducible protein OsmY